MKIKHNLTFKFALIVPFFVFTAMVYSEAHSTDTLVTVTAKTAAYSGKYSPKNCALMWIQKPDKTFIKTIYRAVAELRYLQYFKLWIQSSGGKTANLDGLTGATRKNHNEIIKATWDCTDHDKKPVSNGTYEFWIEMTEDDFLGKSTHGTIEIDGKSKKVQGTTTDFFPILEAEYCIGPCPVSTVKNSKTPDLNKLPVICNGKRISIELPNSGTYSISLISPTGRIINKVNGTGKKAQLSPENNQIERGVYFITISQNDKNYTIEHLFGF